MDEKLLQSIKDAEAKANKIIKDAESQKEKSVSNARKEADQLLKKEISDYEVEMQKYAESERSKIEERKKAIQTEKARAFKAIEKAAKEKADVAMECVAEEFEKIIKG
ncbi:MAG: hypothetical protein HY364_01155 [Candidatus Aenigmarchaeota archaeon]|nr:hypothetical protein [Candidatus Aenigmarchaeota archaeon]